MARTWLQIRVDLLGGGGTDLKDPPGRMFIVGPAHSFEGFVEAINAAFARWDLSHLHDFELGDGRRTGFPSDDFAPDLTCEDHAELKVAREVLEDRASGARGNQECGSDTRLGRRSPTANRSLATPTRRLQPATCAFSRSA